MKNKILLVLILLLAVGCSSKDPVPEPEPTPPPIVDTIPFNLAGSDYTLPLTFESMINDGWEAVDNVEGEIEPHKYVSDIYMRKGTNLIIVSLHNNTDEVIAKVDGLVAVIQAENRTSVNGKDQPVDITVHGDLNYASSPEMIKEKFPDVIEEENDVYKTLIVNHNKLMKTEFKFYKDSGEMRWIIIQNFK